jgi:hypothetical protein
MEPTGNERFKSTKLIQCGFFFLEQKVWKTEKKKKKKIGGEKKKKKKKSRVAKKKKKKKKKKNWVAKKMNGRREKMHLDLNISFFLFTCAYYHHIITHPLDSHCSQCHSGDLPGLRNHSPRKKKKKKKRGFFFFFFFFFGSPPLFFLFFLLFFSLVFFNDPPAPLLSHDVDGRCGTRAEPAGRGGHL